MQMYVIKDYQKGFEQYQIRIGREVAGNWIWPYAFDLDNLLKVNTQPNFDSDTHNVIADIVNKHRQYEPIDQNLGFKKVTEWARCEKTFA